MGTVPHHAIALAAFICMASSASMAEDNSTSGQVAATEPSATVGVVVPDLEPRRGAFQPPAKLLPDEIKVFLDDPNSLLRAFPTGGLPLQNRARSLAGSDSATIKPLAELASGAENLQADIGAGLGRAAGTIASMDTDYATYIQRVSFLRGPGRFRTAFLEASGDVPAASIGGAPASASLSSPSGGGARAAGISGSSAVGTSGGAGSSGGIANVSGDFSVQGGGGLSINSTSSTSPSFMLR